MAARQFLEYRFIPTRESSVLFEIILHQALKKQTGETTRACRFWLQVLNFLQMEGRSAFYRKFLRISDIRELCAATRILSRGSMSSAHLGMFADFSLSSNLCSRTCFFPPTYLLYLLPIFSHYSHPAFPHRYSIFG